MLALLKICGVAITLGAGEIGSRTGNMMKHVTRAHKHIKFEVIKKFNQSMFNKYFITFYRKSLFFKAVETNIRPKIMHIKSYIPILFLNRKLHETAKDLHLPPPPGPAAPSSST